MSTNVATTNVNNQPADNSGVDLKVQLTGVQAFSQFPREPFFLTVQIQETQQPHSLPTVSNSSSSNADEMSLEKARRSKFRTDICSELANDSSVTKDVSVHFNSNTFMFHLFTVMFNDERYCLFDVLVECLQVDENDKNAKQLARGFLRFNMDESKKLFIAKQLDYVLVLKNSDEAEMMRVSVQLDIVNTDVDMKTPNKLHSFIHHMRLSSEVQLQLMREANEMHRAQQLEQHRLFEVELVHLRDVNDQLLKEVKLKNEQTDKLESVLAEERTKMKKMKEDLASMNVQMNSSKKDLQVCLDENKLAREYHRLSKQVQKMGNWEQEKEELVRVHQELSQHIQKLMKKMEVYRIYKKTAINQEKVIRNLEDVVSRKFAFLSRKTRASEDRPMSSDRSRSKRDVDKAIKERDERILKLEEENEQLRVNQEDLERKLKLAKNMEVLQEKDEEEAREKLIFEQEFKTMKKDMEVKTKENADYHLQVLRLQEELQKHQTQVVMLQKEVEEKTRELFKKEEQFAAAILAVPENGSDAQKEQVINDIKKQNTQLHEENLKLKSQVNTMQHQINRLEGKLEAAEFETQESAKRYVDELLQMRLKLSKVNNDDIDTDLDDDDDDFV